jgi:hypothetical protein
MVLPNNFIDELRMDLQALLQPPEEHTQQVRVGITALLLMPVFDLGQVLKAFVVLDGIRNDLSRIII